MITHKEDVPVRVIEGLHGGKGRMIARDFLDLEKSNGAGRLFSVSTLEEGSNIPWHVHDGDSEMFYILEGLAKVTDGDGTDHVLEPGEVAFCRDGEGHAIEAFEGPVTYIAVILFTKQQEV